MEIQNVCVIGSGYVGALQAVVMAAQNPKVHVTVYDINAALIARWQQALQLAEESPIFEPQLDEILRVAAQNNNLTFTAENFAQVATEADCLMIAVNTPPSKEPCAMGQSADLTALKSVLKAIGESISDDKCRIVINKSTVPLGTAEMISDSLRGFDLNFTMVSMPEFLAEGQAIKNLLRPDRIVIGMQPGGAGQAALAAITSLHRVQIEAGAQVISTGCGSAELGKLLANAMLAQRISSINSVTRLLENTADCDVGEVKAIVGSDSRIGEKYLNASPGFGGSCFEKDLLSLVAILAPVDMVAARYWQSVLDMNQAQKRRLADLVTTGPVAVFGFSYKANTGDTRCCQAAAIVDQMAAKGLEVRVHDPAVKKESFEFEMAAQGFRTDGVRFVGDDFTAAVEDAAALVVVTEWPIFTQYDYGKISAQMGPQPVVYDLRRLLDPQMLKKNFSSAFVLGMGKIN